MLNSAVHKIYPAHICQNLGGGGGGGGYSEIFKYMKSRVIFVVQNFEFQYFFVFSEKSIFLGV